MNISPLLRYLALSIVLMAFSQSLPAVPTAEQLQLRLSALAEDSRVAGREVADPWFLASLYERRDFTPVWDDWVKINQLLAAVDLSRRHGLDPEDYHQAQLQDLEARLGDGSSPGARAELELLATDALVRLAFHLRFGKVNPEQIESTWNFSRDMGDLDPIDMVTELVEAEDIAVAVEALAPAGDYYGGLLDYLQRYRELAATGGWPQIDAGETLRAGMSSPRIPPLRRLLALTGDLDAGLYDAADETFDAALEDALKRFQGRHGLEPDGVLGRMTLTALNVPVEARIDQLRVNLERFRWVFRDLEPRFLVANIARFRVVLVEDGQVAWTTRAVVGRPYRQTPVFKARMTYLEINPTWTVPPTILREDLLPDLRRNPDVLRERNMRVLDHQGRTVDPATIDWPSVTWRSFPYMIRQDPGPTNALGLVKLMFPNPYHVYMHDTPARGLFAKPVRSLSSGCIRLEQPFELVHKLLAGTAWDEAAIAAAVAEGRTRVINLPRPITVLMLYGTAVPEAGRIHFAEDIYSRDARLLAALDAPFEFNPPAGYSATGRERVQ